jgi:hypothetical protein
MSDIGLERVKKLEAKFLNIKPRFLLLSKLCGERMNIDAIDYSNENRKFLAKYALGCLYVDHDRF